MAMYGTSGTDGETRLLSEAALMWLTWKMEFVLCRCGVAWLRSSHSSKRGGNGSSLTDVEQRWVGGEFRKNM